MAVPTCILPVDALVFMGEVLIAPQPYVSNPILAFVAVVCRQLD